MTTLYPTLGFCDGRRDKRTDGQTDKAVTICSLFFKARHRQVYSVKGSSQCRKLGFCYVCSYQRFGGGRLDFKFSQRLPFSYFITVRPLCINNKVGLIYNSNICSDDLAPNRASKCLIGLLCSSNFNYLVIHL